MKKTIYVFLLLWCIAGFNGAFAQKQKRQMEKLGRGIVAMSLGTGKGIYVNWRLLATDSKDLWFNLYRSTDGAEAVKVNTEPIKTSTNYVDASAVLTQANTYFVKPVIVEPVSQALVEQEESGKFTVKANASTLPYLSIPMSLIPGDEAYTYEPNDASVGDLDGDGEYEIVVKRDNWSTDNSPTTSFRNGTTKLEAYKLDGTFMWRVDLGYNVRQGAHYTYFMVYDFDGDGKSEIVVRTAEGTTFGDGSVIGDTNNDGKIDYVNESTGMILDGPEFFSVIEGTTGKELARENYISRTGDGNSQSATTQALWTATWGDSYGNRIDRFLGGVGYFDGQRPSILICRGYYKKSVLEAWDFRDGKLSKRWTFDTESSTANQLFRGQGDHSLRVGDIDGDGKDEVIYGSMCVDDNGIGKYNTLFGHGDAIHLGDYDPDHAGLELFNIHEAAGGTISPASTTPANINPTITKIPGWELRDSTGHVIWSIPFSGDTGRGVMFDIDPTHRGAEAWGVGTNMWDSKGNIISSTLPVTAGGGDNCNFGIWWDGDLLRELLDKTVINKWNWDTKGTSRLSTLYNYYPTGGTGVSANNDTKSDPCLSGDILGDWREEAIFRSSDNKEMRIFVSEIVASNRFYTFMNDPVYRLSVATENDGYNQPPSPGFWFGVETTTTASGSTATLGTYSSLTQMSYTLPTPSVYLAQKITFEALPTVYTNNADITPNAVASSGLTLTFTSSEPSIATIVDGKIHVVGQGTCIITATQAGNALYGAGSASQSFTVLPIPTGLVNLT